MDTETPPSSRARGRSLPLAGLALAGLLASTPPTSALPLAEYASIPWPEAEELLRTAEVGAMARIPVGVTGPRQVTLSAGDRTFRAVFKSIDEYRPLQRFDDGGLPEIAFSDSYKHEIAAYELDKMLGLDMVPPTVARRIRGRPGSLQLWLEGTMTEKERLDRGLTPPDRVAWSDQIHRIRVWHQLIDDRDFNNVGNLLVDDDFRIYVIDSSRAFRMGKTLQSEGNLRRFSRELLGRLRALDSATLRARLGDWLSAAQIEALLSRRDLLLECADRLVAERGEAAVLY